MKESNLEETKLRDQLLSLSKFCCGSEMVFVVKAFLKSSRPISFSDIFSVPWMMD